MKEKNPVVIVGMGGCFPQASNPEAYWQLIRTGANVAQPHPHARTMIPIESVHQEGGPVADKVTGTYGYFVDHESLSLDYDLLDISSGLLDSLDPMFKLGLYAATEAWKDAKTEGVDKHKVGVIIGNIVLPTDHASKLARAYLGRGLQWAVNPKNNSGEKPPTHPWDTRPAGLPGAVIARSLGFAGGSFTLDAACASSLFALKLAAEELLSGKLDAVITGGLSRPDCLYTQMGFSQLRALSPTGLAAPFDGRGNGLVVGEGAGMFVLKRMDDALAAGDQIYAVIEGVGLSNDTDGSLLAPSSEGQLRAMRTAYEKAGWSVNDLDLIECHATGTPLGDQVEFNSLRELWADSEHTEGQCVIGSVKGTIGHLLTAAGSASLMKVLLAMKEEQLPPTSNFQSTGDRFQLEGSPFRVLTQPEAWSRDQRPRRAAVSAFGFGGTNAHVLLSQYEAEQWKPQATQTQKPAAVAVVGIGNHFGPWTNTQDLTTYLMGETKAAETQKGLWWGLEKHIPANQLPPAGYYVDELKMPLGRFRIPPVELAEMLPQQLLLMLAASEALEDAGFDREEANDCGIFAGIGLDLNTTNYQLRWDLDHHAARWNEELNLGLNETQLAEWTAELRKAAGPALNANRVLGGLGGLVGSRVAREFRFGGPCMSISSDESSGIRALETAIGCLSRGELNLALVGAVDMSGDIRSLLASDRRDKGFPGGEGATALVLKRLEDAEKDGDTIYGVIDGLATQTGENDARAQVLQTALDQAEVAVDAISYLESPSERQIPEELLSFLGEHKLALGNVSTDIGHTGAATGLAAVTKALLALHYRVLPRHLAPPKNIDDPTGFQASSHSRFWTRDSKDGPRRAAVSLSGSDSNHSAVVIRGYDESRPAMVPMEPLQMTIIPVRAESQEQLRGALNQLRSWMETQSTPLHQIGRDWWQHHGKQTAAHNLMLVPSSKEELAQLAGIAAHALSLDDPTSNIPFSDAIKTKRIFWRAQPLGKDAPVAFVFPGSGSHFHGMGREIAMRWPHGFLDQDQHNKYMDDELRPDLSWGDRTPASIDKEHRALLSAQVALNIGCTRLLNKFGLDPNGVIGYSLGESAGLHSTGVWRNVDAMHLRTKHSDLFHSVLANECTAVRQHWKLADDEDVDWAVGVVPLDAETVKAHLPKHDRVYLLIINTPNECVLGGNRTAMKNFTDSLGVRYFPLQGVVAVHCEVATPVADQYREQHVFETYPPPGVRYYSGARGESYEVNSESAADSIIQQALYGIDFPKTISTAWEDGFRIFVEIGPGASCSRMIGQILGDKPHLARSICQPGSDQEGKLLRTLASLMAEGIDVNLDYLFSHVASQPEDTARTVSIPLAGQHFQATLPPSSAKPAPAPAAAAPAPQAPKPVAAQPKKIIPKPTPTPVAQPAAPSAPVQAPQPVVQNTKPAPQRVAAATMEDPLQQPTHHQVAAVDTSATQSLLEQQAALIAANTAAHEAYLNYAENAQSTMAAAIEQQTRLLQAMAQGGVTSVPVTATATAVAEPPAPAPIAPPSAQLSPAPVAQAASSPTPVAPAEPEPTRAKSGDRRIVAFDRDMCLEYARGSIGKMLGPEFAPVDDFPSRVRLPDEPLMLVDRIVDVGGERMTAGFVVTEHDVLHDGWYLDSGRIATCVAIEAGQADLFLGAYLGVDFETKGLAMYRLLDAKVTFHSELPKPGDVIRYDIFIDGFFRQGNTHFFRFRFDGTVNGKPLLTMREGVAGFFSNQELESGKGIVRREKDVSTAKRCDDWIDFTRIDGVETYQRKHLDALRAGDLEGCFGEQFANLPINRPLGLPTGLMELVDRVTHLDPTGGEFGMGMIKAQMDINPDDWFLTCHFIEDEVMPGTLMYECCLHTLRFFLMRHGWVGEAAEVVCQPIVDVASKLLCRGQVLQHTKTVTYEVHIRELGYGPEPYCIADAYMYSDQKCIVDITDMCVRFSGLSKDKLEAIWAGRNNAVAAPAPPSDKPVMDYNGIYALANGNPSDFGDRYKPFDNDRLIARFPRPPFLFMDCVPYSTVEQWKLAAGGETHVCYDVPSDAWYFEADRQPVMPYAVLLEVALQACGWNAAYMGCALLADERLLFRNLGGNATQYLPVEPDIGTLTTHVKVKKVSKTKDVILLFFDFEVMSRHGAVYKGDTYFGFFTEESMANQVGVTEHEWYGPTESELSRGQNFPYPAEAPYPDRKMRMMDNIDLYLEQGGKYGLGYVEGSLDVDPSLWFFEAHFYQDPVWPGSLGLEAFQQLLKVYAGRYFEAEEDTVFQNTNLNSRHTWIYRGQVVPTNRRVSVQANIREIDEETRTVIADGYLMVDGVVIYQIDRFGISLL